MDTRNKQGFTIIETVLFLGVSGMLAVGILAGTGGAVNQQRYRDSVNSFRSVLQSQFSEVANVRNERTDDWQCNTQGIVTPPQGVGAGLPRGTSECVVLGRYIRSYDNNPSNNGGESLYAYTVIGRQKSSVVSANNDIEAFGNYHITITDTIQDEEPLEWGATTRIPGVANEALFSVLIVRSPSTGGIRTYIPEPGTKINDTNVSSIITEANIKRPLKVCIDFPGSFIAGGTMAVQIAGNATNQSAIETLANENGC